MDGVDGDATGVSVLDKAEANENLDGSVFSIIGAVVDGVVDTLKLPNENLKMEISSFNRTIMKMLCL